MTLLLFLFCITSCSKNAVAQRNRKADRDKEEIINITPVEPTTETIPLIIDTLISEEAPENNFKNRTFNVALLLPLFLNELKPEEEDSAKTPRHNTAAAQGINLYEGIKFAFDSLAKTGAGFNLNIIDTKQDEETVKSIVVKPEFYDADLIIGPVYNSSMKIAAEHAGKYRIPIVAPLSPAENISSNNEYFFQVNPGLSTHCKTLFDYVEEKYRNENILLIHQAVTDNEVYEHFKSLFNNSAKNMLYKDLVFSAGKFLDATNVNPAMDLKSRLKSNGNNIIIVASYDLQFAHKLSRQLYNLSSDYTFVVMGLPVWYPENDLRLDYLEKINTHFTQGSYITDTLFFDAPFAKKFNDTFGHFPNETNYKGFDIAYYFGELLMAYGKKFPEKIDNDFFPLNHSVFKIQRKYSIGTFEKETQFLYFENNHVFLFKYENFGLKRLK